MRTCAKPSPTELAVQRTCAHPSPTDRAVRRVYWTPELLTQVLRLCEWPSLMLVSRCNRYGRDAVRVVVEEKMRQLLEPFVGPVEVFKTFMQALEKSGGGLVGSIVRRLLAVNAPFLAEVNEATSLKYDSSFDLNIVVPRGEISFMIDWFTKLGWGEWEYRMPACGYRPNVTTFVTARKDVGGRKVCVYHLVSFYFQLTIIKASPSDNHREFWWYHARGTCLPLYCTDEPLHPLLGVLCLSHYDRPSAVHEDG